MIAIETMQFPCAERLVPCLPPSASGKHVYPILTHSQGLSGRGYTARWCSKRGEGLGYDVLQGVMSLGLYEHIMQ